MAGPPWLCCDEVRKRMLRVFCPVAVALPLAPESRRIELEFPRTFAKKGIRRCPFRIENSKTPILR
jgi:hypothetical protein